ncbi:MAG: type IV pilin [Methanoculleus bourgensis]|uniref:Type IV pilin n=1 Tax=Methanoculleus bourgensis TaxID=83986 RepID=A0A8T7H5B7_9EURY|nr:type IV pilin [Methanoculleus bourgensis]
MQEYVGGMKNARGVSEVISVVLLIGVVVVGVGIIAVTIYSQPTPAEIPEVSILVSNTSDGINLTHNGGDSLQEGSFYVLADGERLGDATLQNGAWPWSIGEVLRYDVEATPEEVQVVYTGAGGEVLLKSARFQGGAATGGPDIIPEPPEESELELGEIIKGFVDALESDSIYLYQKIESEGKVWKVTGFFNFTISDKDSYLHLSTKDKSPERVSFEPDEQISIQLSSDSKIRLFTIGSGNWHIFATDATVYSDGQSLKEPEDPQKPYSYIFGGRLHYEVDKFTSSVTITTPSDKNPHTELYINNTLIINGTCNQEINLTNIKPTKTTMMILDISKNDPCYFIGAAESITGHT